MNGAPRSTSDWPPTVPAGRGRSLGDASIGSDAVDAEALELLAADAAGRAAGLLTATAPAAAPLSAWQDVVRFAAEHSTAEVFARIAQRCGRPPIQLAAAVRAWRHGGLDGLNTLEESWTPNDNSLKEDVDAGLADLPTGVLPPRRWRNQITFGTDLQLRLSPGGRWYPYIRKDGEWWPVEGADSDLGLVLAEHLDG